VCDGKPLGGQGHDGCTSADAMSERLLMSTLPRIASSATAPPRYPETGWSVFSSRRTRAPPRTVEPVLMVAKNALSWCLSRRAAVSKARMTGGPAEPERNRRQARLNASRRCASAQKNTCRLTRRRQHAGRPLNLPASVGSRRRSGICCGRSTATPPLSKLMDTKVSRFAVPSRKALAGSRPVSLSQGPAPSASMTCQTRG